MARKRLTEDPAKNIDGALDGSDLFEDPELLAHLEDAQLRAAILRQLLEARATSGLTQAEIATRMGTTQSAVSELEGGGTDPRLSTLQRYARAVESRLYAHLRDPAAVTIRAAYEEAVALGDDSVVDRVSGAFEMQFLVAAGINNSLLVGHATPVEPVEEDLISEIYGKVA